MPTAVPPTLNELPYLTSEIPPVPAAIKRRYEDFRVEEIPAYQPCGEGSHVYFTIEKQGLSTMRAVADIARALDVPRREIGVAGLKDARAVAVQMMSLEHVDPEAIRSLNMPRLRVLAVERHGNKLKIGHLRGNRFRIKLRDVDAARIPDIQAVCDVLARRGVPNYFGQQRFGLRGDTWQLGQAVLRNDAITTIDLMLGRPGPYDTGEVLKARQLYEAGDYAESARHWRGGFRDNVVACRAMARSGGKHKRAYHAMDLWLKKFYVNAYQSWLFNRVLAERIGEIDKVVEGDLAYKHDHGAVFRVEDAAAESPRVAAFEISPTGPLFGPKMTQPTGRPGEIEQVVLDSESLRLDDFRKLGRMKIHGARRPLRFRPEELKYEAGRDEFGDHIELSFTLSSGCYATMIMREICKQHLEEGLEEDGDAAAE